MIKKIYIFFHPLVGLDHDLHQFLGVENLSFGYILFLFYYYIQYFEKSTIIIAVCQSSRGASWKYLHKIV